MRRVMSIAAAAAIIAGGTAIGGSAQAGTVPDASLGMVTNTALPLEEIQFFWGGYNYCWYGNAWNGPGYYWCGYHGVTATAGAAAMGGTAGAGWRWCVAWWRLARRRWPLAWRRWLAWRRRRTSPLMRWSSASGTSPAASEKRVPDNDHEKKNYTESLKV